jgi:hypothetical protein
VSGTWSPGAGGIVGRTRELAVLRGHLDQAVEGVPALVLVVGEAGIGKTALLDEVARSARPVGMEVVRGDARGADASTFALWAGPRQRLGLGGQGDDDEDTRLGADERRWEVLDELAAALDGRAPIVVVLDDVHWADEPSLWVLERLVGAVHGPVLVVAAGRDDEAGAANGNKDDEGEPALSARLRPAAVIRLGGLTAPDIEALAHRLDPTRTVDGAEVATRTGGNPLFVREVVGSPGVDIPEAVGPLLDRTLGRLSERAQLVVSALALAGTDTPRTVLGAALELAPDEVADALAEAASAHVLEPDASHDGRLGIRHDLLRVAAIARLPAERRWAVHRDLARALSAAGPTAQAAGRAAAHLLAAVPLVDPLVAVGRAREAASRLVDGRDGVAAAALLGQAAHVLADDVPDMVDLRARVAVDRGDALEVIGDVGGAEGAYDEAVGLAEHVPDPILRATVALASARRRPMHTDEPEHRAQLQRAEQGLPPGDHPLRAGLLSRRAVGLMARPELQAEAEDLADEAVAMARRLGDPALVATTLVDRAILPRTPDQLRSRVGDAPELARLAAQAGRPDLALVAHEWRYADAMQRGDLAGAATTLDRYELEAAIMPSPAWSFGAGLRRAMLETLAGRRDRALDALARALPLGHRAVLRTEALGVEEGVRTLIVLLTGLPDPQLAEVHREVVERMGGAPHPFFQIHLAVSALVIGDRDEARRIVRTWGPLATDPGRGAEVPAIVGTLGTAVAELRMVEQAAAVRRALAPFAGFLTTELSFPCELPVDTTLARLALLDGDPSAALAHARAGAALAAASGSPVLGAWAQRYLAQALLATGTPGQAEAAERASAELAAGCGVVLPGHGAAAGPPPTAPSAGPRPVEVALRRERSAWRIDSPLGAGTVPASRGLDQLVRILTAAPGEVAAIDLFGAPEAPVAADLGPVLDATAKRAYRRRIAELQAEIDEADDFADLERAARHRLELDALLDELRSASGLGGRDRPNASGAERARVNVTRSVRRAIDAVAGVVPALGDHLAVSVRTGRTCAYRPESSAALRWTVVDQRL